MATGRCTFVHGHRMGTLASSCALQPVLRTAKCQPCSVLKHHLALVVLFTVPFSLIAQAEPPEFNRDIRPILSRRCFKCHGPDENAREVDLRLDRREVAVDSGAVVPGNPDESLIMERITSNDPDLRMPPAGDLLSAKEIQMLGAWIESGAGYERHWSYQRPVVAVRPQVRDESWPAGELDFFVLQQIEKSGLTPSPRAKPAALLRRLYLDLIGLPPTVEDVLAFEKQPTPTNYEAHVDRLLRSDRFGEKWAAGWLDLARYADSNGYQHDDLRTMWPYRDWVIRALNDDMPFDQFTIQQLAGDLLPNPSTSQLVATGFNRNVPTNFSGGSKVPEVRANILHDRVATTGAVWLGLTLECAQCHDHKFDAVTQREYYQLYAFFNQAIPEVTQQGQGMFRKLFVGREVTVYATEADEKQARTLRQILEAEEQQLADQEPLDDKRKGTETIARAEKVILDFEQIDPLATNNTSSPAVTSAVEDVPEGGGRRAGKTFVDPPTDAGFFGTGFSFPAQDLSELNEITFWIKTDIASQFNFQVHNRGNQAAVFSFDTFDVKPDTWIRFTAPVDSFKAPPWSTGAVDWSNVMKCQVTAFGSGPYSGKYIMLDSVVGAPASEHELRRKRIDQLRKELSEFETRTMVMQDSDQLQPTHLMIRGDYATLGDRVEADTIAALHPFTTDLPRDRLGLAKWLVAPENPLTARVTVNRIWAEIFGHGIVATPEDFGMQGAAPKHPKLLDWLAVHFVEDGWSLKRLIKTIVMSSTYQQTSSASEELIQKDPENALYARGPRFRLTSELVRDNLLAVSGLLSDKIGGPVVYPAQPEGLWEEILGVDVTKYPTSSGDDRYRRGIYTIWRRGNPYPSMISFDSPDRSRCTVQRDRSNTPLQALTLLNDPVYVEMAVEFSRVIESWNGSDRDKVIRAFRRAVARRPSDDEVQILVELRQIRQSWFPVVQALMNLDETISKS